MESDARQIEEAPPVTEESLDRMVKTRIADMERATPEAIAAAREYLQTQEK